MPTRSDRYRPTSLSRWAGVAGLALPVDRLHLGAVMLVAIPGTPFWLMCLLVGSVSLLNPVFKASQLALLPDVLPGGRFAVGMAIRNMTVQSAQLLGFAGGGLLVAALNPRAALVIDGLTFLASALLLRAGLRPRPAAAVRDAGGPTGAELPSVGHDVHLGRRWRWRRWGWWWRRWGRGDVTCSGSVRQLRA